jgi:tryptophanyl-tRNA synthetase
MAADIIIHKADKVPVGKDQEQNLEMARTFARRFNHMYHVDFFPQPSAFNFGEQLVKIPGLDGSGKMGKSEGEGNAIFLNDDPKALRKKVMRAVSDSGPTEMNQVKPEPIENLFSLMKAVSTPDTVDYFNDQYNNCSIRYGDMKKQLAEDMIAFTTPFRERIMELSADQDYITRVMNLGAEKARESGRATVEEVRQIIGFRKYYTFT